MKNEKDIAMTDHVRRRPVMATALRWVIAMIHGVESGTRCDPTDRDDRSCQLQAEIDQKYNAAETTAARMALLKKTIVQRDEVV